MIKIAFDNPYQIPKFIKDKIYQVLTDLVNNGFRFTFDHLYCFDFTD
jgi:uncharacterized protein (DUF2126 family)